MLFDQNYAVNVHTEQIARRREMKTTVKMCQRFGASIIDTIRMLAEDFSLDEKEATNYVRKFWKN